MSAKAQLQVFRDPFTHGGVNYEIVTTVDQDAYMVVAIQGGAEASFRYGAAHSFAGQFQATQGSSIITHLVEMAKDDVGRDVLAAFRASQA